MTDPLLVYMKLKTARDRDRELDPGDLLQLHHCTPHQVLTPLHPDNIWTDIDMVQIPGICSKIPRFLILSTLQLAPLFHIINLLRPSVARQPAAPILTGPCPDVELYVMLVGKK